MMFNSEFMRNSLEEAYERLKGIYFSTSALRVVRMYSPRDSADLELWTLFCAITDFQISVIKWLIPMLSGLCEEIEGKGLKFIDLIYDLQLARKLLSTFSWGSNKKGFAHRFIDLEDLICLFTSLKNILTNYGSLGNFAKNLYEDAMDEGLEEPLEYVVKGLAQELRSHFPDVYGKTGMLVPDPSGNSAFKRLNLFLRWMVRPYPDLGLWNFIDKRFLLVSLDIGVLRTVSRVFDVRFAGGSVWKNVLKVTKLFRNINSEDPVKYDYVFSRPAIMGYCAKDPARNRCYLCPLNEICSSASLPFKPKVKPLTSSKERKILDEFLKIDGDKFDEIKTEYPVGGKSIDVVAHDRNCNWYVMEVEEKLNYTAIGQAVTYRKLFTEIKKIRPKAVIICRDAPLDLKAACEVDVGIEVILV